MPNWCFRWRLWPKILRELRGFVIFDKFEDYKSRIIRNAYWAKRYQYFYYFLFFRGVLDACSTTPGPGVTITRLVELGISLARLARDLFSIFA